MKVYNQTVANKYVLVVIRQLDNSGRTWTCPCAAASSRGGRAETCMPAQQSWAHCLWCRWQKSSWVEAAAGDDWVLRGRDTKDVQGYNFILISPKCHYCDEEWILFDLAPPPPPPLFGPGTADVWPDPCWDCNTPPPAQAAERRTW